MGKQCPCICQLQYIIKKVTDFHKILYDYHTSRYHPTFIIVNIIGILILMRTNYFIEPTLKQVNCLNSLKTYFKFYTHFALQF